MPRGLPAPEGPGAPRGNLAVRRGTDRRLGGGREAWHHSAFPAEAKPMSLRRCLLLALVASPLLLFGCKIETINYFPDKTAKVRFANLVVGAPNVTGFVDGTVLWPEVAFQGVTAYSTLEPVQHSFALLVAGNPAVSNSTNYTLNGTSNYTLFAYGTPGVPSTAILLEPTNSPGTNTFQTRVLNLAPNTGSFDLYVIEPATSILNASPNVTGLNYGSIGVFLSFGAGTYRIVATETGTKVPIFDAGPVNLPGDTRANLVAYSVGGANLITMALFQTTGDAPITPLRNLVSRVRAVNIANATGAVDVLANDSTLFRDIAEGNGLDPGAGREQELRFRRHGGRDAGGGPGEGHADAGRRDRHDARPGGQPGGAVVGGAHRQQHTLVERRRPHANRQRRRRRQRRDRRRPRWHHGARHRDHADDSAVLRRDRQRDVHADGAGDRQSDRGARDPA